MSLIRQSRRVATERPYKCLTSRWTNWFPLKAETDNKSLSDSRLAVTHVWVKVGQQERDVHTHARSGVGHRPGPPPDRSLTLAWADGLVVLVRSELISELLTHQQLSA